MKIVFSIGGSILAPDEIDDALLGDTSEFLKVLSGKNKLYVVAGGGKIARKYIASAKKSGADEVTCDWLGIYATRLNALLLASAIGRKANRQIPTDIEAAIGLSNSNEILVMGGTDPHHSTDAVAATLADKVDADIFINASNIDGVFDKDPDKNPGARLLDEINIQDLYSMVSDIPQSPGNYALIDKMAVESIMHSKAKTIVLNGRDIENMRKAIAGEEFTGTVVTH